MRTKTTISILLSCLVWMSANGQTNSGIEHGPWISGISETGFSILWTSNSPALSWVEILCDANQETRQVYEVVSGRKVTGTFHTVSVSDLRPGMHYTYRICGKNMTDASNPYVLKYDEPEVWSQDFHVSTPDISAKECRFSIVNDMHFMYGRYRKLTEMLDPKSTDFLLLNGDICSYAHSADSVVKYSFGPISGISGSLPVVFSRGNHETKGLESYRLKDIFPTPTGELYWCFREGPAFFIVLDNGGKTPDSDPGYSGDAEYDLYRARQTKWLEEVLGSDEYRSAPVRIAVVHMPPIGPDTGSYAQKWMSATWLPMLSKAGIDFMLCGHQHRHNLFEPGSFGNGFPIYVNSNTERMDVSVSADSYSIKTFNEGDVLTHQYSGRIQTKVK